VSENVSNFDKARELALSDESGVKSEIVEHETPNGKARFKVIPLTLEEQRFASEWATIRKVEKRGGKDVEVVDENPFMKGAAMMILAVRDPDTDKPLFTKADLKTVMSRRDHRLFAKLIQAAARVSTVESVEEAAGNSASAPTDSSSTN
jgi:hypothetical protein